MEERSLIFDETPSRIPVQASRNKRLVNYIVDIICYYAFLFLIAIILIALPFGLDELEIEESPLSEILERLIGLLLYALFMGLVEALFKGKSLGKLVTGTRAVNEDGSRISVKTAFLRGLSRAVPFAPFSAFDSPPYPWQDRWTRTYVIDEKLSVKDDLISDQAPDKEY